MKSLVRTRGRLQHAFDMALTFQLLPLLSSSLPTYSFPQWTKHVPKKFLSVPADDAATAAVLMIVSLAHALSTEGAEHGLYGFM